MNRYSRQIILPQIGLLGQQKLQNAKVLVIGAGGLGCAVLPYLTTGGIGTIGIIDGDKIDESNLPRQVLYPENAVGESKVLQAKLKLEALNSAVKIKVYNYFLSAGNAVSLIKDYDVVIDATDSLAIRYLINDACIIANKPFVYGSVYRFEGQVSVFNYKNGPTYRCLFKDRKSNVQNCEVSGVLGTTVGLIGMFQANEVLKIILETGDLLCGRLLLYNALNNSQSIFQFKKDESFTIDEEFYQSEYFENEIVEISIEEALAANLHLIDVRELGETPKIEFENLIKIPLSVLEDKLHLLTKNETYALFCQNGARSLAAIKILQKHGFTQVRNIQESAFTVRLVVDNKSSALK